MVIKYSIRPTLVIRLVMYGVDESLYHNLLIVFVWTYLHHVMHIKINDAISLSINGLDKISQSPDFLTENELYQCKKLDGHHMKITEHTKEPM